MRARLIADFWTLRPSELDEAISQVSEDHRKPCQMWLREYRDSRYSGNVWSWSGARRLPRGGFALERGFYEADNGARAGWGGAVSGGCGSDGAERGVGGDGV